MTVWNVLAEEYEMPVLLSPLYRAQTACRPDTSVRTEIVTMPLVRIPPLAGKPSMYSVTVPVALLGDTFTCADSGWPMYPDVWARVTTVVDGERAFAAGARYESPATKATVSLKKSSNRMLGSTLRRPQEIFSIQHSRC